MGLASSDYCDYLGRKIGVDCVSMWLPLGARRLGGLQEGSCCVWWALVWEGDSVPRPLTGKAGSWVTLAQGPYSCPLLHLKCTSPDFSLMFQLIGHICGATS